MRISEVLVDTKVYNISVKSIFYLFYRTIHVMYVCIIYKWNSHHKQVLSYLFYSVFLGCIALLHCTSLLGGILFYIHPNILIQFAYSALCTLHTFYDESEIRNNYNNKDENCISSYVFEFYNFNLEQFITNVYLNAILWRLSLVYWALLNSFSVLFRHNLLCFLNKFHEPEKIRALNLPFSESYKIN